MKLRWLVILSTVGAISGTPAQAPSGGAQRAPDGDDRTRQIIAEEFLKARPVAAKPSGQPKPRYRPVDANKPAASVAAGVELGLTLWRLKPAAAGTDADAARLLVQESGAAPMIAERVDTGVVLAVGDRVRLTIESPHAGRLYVVDREIYADGTTSDPYLIFPTSRTRKGDNAVRPGRLVDIPDQQDRPSFFTVKPSRPGQLGELLTIIVAPSELEGVTIGDGPLRLAPDLVRSWEKSWTTPVQQFAQEGGKRLWTRQEQVAASDLTRLLTQEDPAPQTIFRLAAKKGSPILVNVRLPYAASDR